MKKKIRVRDKVKCKCGNLKSSWVKYCRTCSLKERFKNKKNHPMYGKNHTTKSKEKMSISAKKRGYSIKQLKLLWEGNKNKSIHKHHLDLNEDNNSKNNILKLLTNGKHQLFHRYAYHYLLKKFGIKEILKYKNWFERKYGL